MKHLFSRISTRAKVAYATLLALIVIVIPVMVIASPGPDRPTKVYNGPGTPGFNYVTFDSFTNVPGIGDERYFFNGTYPGGSAFTDPLPQVKNGDVLTLQVYVHNNADPSLNDAPGQPGIARNTTVRVALPSGLAKAQEATAYISASNAQPQTVWDTLNFGAADGGAFQIQYIPGSAHVRGNYIDTSLPDSIVTSGATIGTNALDGNLKGCFQQEVYVTLQVKVSVPQYQFTKMVSTTGSTAWTKSVDSVAGQTDKWLLTFNNSGQAPLSSVVVVDQVPAGLTVVPNTVELINGNYPNGYFYPAGAVQDNGRTININIGNYNPGILAYIRFNTTVDQPASTVCAPFDLTNKAYAAPEGFGALSDTASVHVTTHNQCTQPQYTCNLLSVTQGDNKTVTINKFDTTATNGAVFKDVVISWGDTSTPLTTNNAVGQTHQYSGNGPYTISAVAHFTVNGQDVTSSGNSCSAQVNFTTPPQTPPTTLVNTGPGQVVGLFSAVTIVSAFAHRWFLARRLSRN